MTEKTHAANAIRRLTPDEAREGKAQLEKELSPSEMRSRWEGIKTTTDAFAVVQPEISSFMRDAFVAFHFAEILGAPCVWLVAADRPDFGVRFSDGRVCLFEATISDLPGRKMAELYKTKILPERIAGTEQVESDQDIRDLFFKMDAELARTMLVNACAKKLDKKRYDSSWGLVIHLNPSCGSDERASVEAVLAEATASVKDAFSEVWVLWGKRLYQTWLDGRPSSRPFATLVEEENWKSDGAAFSALFEPD